MPRFILIFCLISISIQMVLSQCLNRPANPCKGQEIIDTTLHRPLQVTAIENPNLIPAASPTTIITDCTPSVCKNLVNTLQLMIVCNLLKDTQGGSEIAAQLASPILTEVLASCPCHDGRFPNPISPNLISSDVISTNLVSPNFVSPNLNPAVIASGLAGLGPVLTSLGVGIPNVGNSRLGIL